MAQVQESADEPRPPGGFDHSAARRSILSSLILNALCPYVLFRALEPRFPAESVVPLLYASIFSVIGFLLARRLQRSVDAIALIALAGILSHLTLTVLAPNLSTALVLRALEGAIIGVCFLISAAIGRPIVLYIGRQFVSAGAPGKRAGFEAMVARGADLLLLAWSARYILRHVSVLRAM